MNKPKRKRQPTAECYREQLAVAADTIIELKTELSDLADGAYEVRQSTHGEPGQRRVWWRRIFRKS